MIFTEEIQTAELEEKTNQGGNTVKACIKVKSQNGNFTTIIPMTNTTAVVGTSGKLLDVELEEIYGNISQNDVMIEQLSGDTKKLMEQLTSLQNYVNPLLEQLKIHIEFVDSDDAEGGGTIFDHIFEDIDTIYSKINNIETSMSNIDNKLAKVISDNEELVQVVNDLSNRLALHEDVIITDVKK